VKPRDLSPELERFIAAEVRSVEQLEILLLLAGEPGSWWGASGVYEVVKSNPLSVEIRLEEFVRDGILKKQLADPPAYQFSAANGPLVRVVSELRAAYAERPVRIVQAIYAKPLEPAEEFAEAFRLKKGNRG
jgi:hypothetical protein